MYWSSLYAVLSFYYERKVMDFDMDAVDDLFACDEDFLSQIDKIEEQYYSSQGKHCNLTH